MRGSNRLRNWLGVTSCTLAIALSAASGWLVADFANRPSPEALQTETPSELSVEGGQPLTSRTYDASTVLIGLEPNADPALVNAALAALPCVESPAVTTEDVELGLASLNLARNWGVEAAVDQLNGICGVSHAGPEHIYHLADASGGYGLVADSSLYLQGDKTLIAVASAINDKFASEQWHLEALAGIDAYGAWDVVRAGEAAAPATVAIIDSGCDDSHEDLADNIIARYNAINKTQTCTPASHDKSHGTHVSGIISAVSNNNLGVSGVTFNTKILPIRVFYDDMTTATTAIVGALNYAVSHKDDYNIRVVNLSLGGERSESYDEFIMAAIKRAYDAGIVVVCAAGNQNVNQGLAAPYAIFPGDDVVDAPDGPYGLNVISLDKDATRSSFSNYNVSNASSKDISAPGRAIYSTRKNGEYGIDNGTSMAAPIVSGVAALMFTANPNLSAQRAIEIIHESATDIGDKGFDAETGYGEVNASKAVRTAIPELTGSATVYRGQTSELAAPGEGAWEWRSSDASVATVEAGRVTGVATGNATIVAVSGSTRAYKDIVVQEAPASEETQTQDTPEHRAESEQHDIANHENKADDKDSATRTTDDAVTKQPQVKPRTNTFKVSSPAPMAYTGRAITPTPIVRVNGKTIGRGAYSLSYSNNVAVGMATVAVTGKGAYEGASGSARFAIVRAPQHLSVKTKTARVKARALKTRSRAVKCVQRVNGTKGDVVFKKLSGSKNLTINASTGAVKVKKKTKRGTYKASVSAYARASANFKRSNTVTKTLVVKVR